MPLSRKKTARRLRRTVTERDGAPALSVTAKSTLIALPITVAIGLLFLFITTALLLTAKDPNRYHTAAGYGVLYLTALLGGFAAVRLNHRRAPLLCGIGEAVMILIVITIPGLCLPDSWGHDIALGIKLLTRAALFPATLVGAWIAARRPQKRRRR